MQDQLSPCSLPRHPQLIPAATPQALQGNPTPQFRESIRRLVLMLLKRAADLRYNLQEIHLEVVGNVNPPQQVEGHRQCYH